MKQIRVGIVGAGPMGRLQARTIFGLSEARDDCVLAAVVDHHEGRAESVAEEFGSIASTNLEEVISELDAAVVCVPTSSHFSISKQLLENDIDILVEKPFATSIVEGQRLGVLADERRLILQVGHVEWYNSAWREAVRRAGEPRAIEVERLHPPADRGLDLDVVQDLMLHDLDWVTRHLEDEIVGLEAKGRSVLNNQFDEAEVMIRFKRGCLATLRASRVHRERRRQVRIEGEAGVATADLLTRSVSGPGTDRGPGRDPLEAQGADFLDSVVNRTIPKADASVGVAVLEIVDRVRNAIVQGAGSLDREDDSALSG